MARLKEEKVQRKDTGINMKGKKGEINQINSMPKEFDLQIEEEDTGEERRMELARQ